MMKKTTVSFAALAAVALLGINSQTSAQDCVSCNTSVGFAYPTTTAACGPGGCGLRGGLGHGGGHFQEFRNKMEHYSVLNAKIAARNDAWPKPFACLDKRDYHNIWSTMLNAGTETQCVLDGDFFTEANELNRIGIDRVRGIMANMPSDNRTVFVHRTNDDMVNEARMDAIRNTIDLYYSHKGPAKVALSNKVPRTISGHAVQVVQESRESNMAPPIIQVGDGDSVSNAVQN